MHLTNRQQRIMSALQARKQVSVEELSGQLFFSPSTIRRELETLQQYGLLHRTHGGASIRSGWDEGVPVLIREAQEVSTKKMIAEAAARFVQDGDHVFMDSSSSTLMMVDFLEGRKDLTIITNGLQLATQLIRHPQIKTICTGGQLVTTSLSFIGPHTYRFMDCFYADKVFFSSSAISGKYGVTDNSEMEAQMKNQMVMHANEAYCLADVTKIDCGSTYKVCNAADVYMLITNAGAELFDGWLASPQHIHCCTQ